MKRKYLVLILVVASVLSGCQNSKAEFEVIDIMENVEKPKNNNTPLIGTWELTRIDDSMATNTSEAKFNIGDPLYISEKVVSFSNRYTTRPCFNARLVKTEDYVAIKGNEPLNLLEETKTNYEVINIKDGQKFLQDIVKLSGGKIAFCYESRLFEFKKVSDTVPKEIIEVLIEKEKDLSLNTQYHQTAVAVDTSIIIGVKSVLYDGDGSPSEIYDSYLLRKKVDSAPLIYRMKNLFVPRSSGFWFVGVDQIVDQEFRGEKLYAYPTSVHGDKSQQKNYIQESKHREITFVNDGYIGVQVNGIPADGIYQFEIHNTESLSNNKPLTILEIGGEDGLAHYKETLNKEWQILTDSDKTTELLAPPSNIGIVRKNGRWQYASTLFLEDRIPKSLRQFSLDFVPAIELFKVNDLAIPWSDIQTKVPNAKDAHTSPNGDLVIIQDGDELMLYTVNGGIIGNVPVVSIPLSKTSSIVMAEWAFNAYAGLWEESFTTFKLSPVQYY